MNIRLNGQTEELNEGSTVLSLVTQQSQDSSFQGIAVALNGEVIRRASWESTLLSQDDDVEILHAVAGG